MIPNQLEEMRKKDLFYTKIFYTGLILFLILMIAGKCLGNSFNYDCHIQELLNYVSWFHQNVSPQKERRALKIVPIVVKHSLQKEIDPLLIGTIIGCESSWKPDAIGKSHNEIGLMQVHSKAKGDFDLTTIDGQIDAGTTWFKKCLNKCKSIKGALSMYATGKCYKWKKGAERRYTVYKKAVEKFRTCKQ